MFLDFYVNISLGIADKLNFPSFYSKWNYFLQIYVSKNILYNYNNYRGPNKTIQKNI